MKSSPMRMSKVEVYKQSDAFKIGWVHGLYDCKPEDSAIYGAEPRFILAAGNNGTANDDYRHGYQIGRACRLSTEDHLLRHPKKGAKKCLAA